MHTSMTQQLLTCVYWLYFRFLIDSGNLCYNEEILRTETGKKKDPRNRLDWVKLYIEGACKEIWCEEKKASRACD